MNAHLGALQISQNDRNSKASQSESASQLDEVDRIDDICVEDGEINKISDKDGAYDCSVDENPENDMNEPSMKKAKSIC